MDKFGFERNLIRFASKENIEKREKFRFTGRVKAYSVLLVVLLLILTTLILTRKTVDSYMSRVSGQLYQEIGKDSLSNYYILKVINKNTRDIPFDFKVGRIEGTVKVVGNKKQILKREALTEYYLWIFTNRNQIHRRNTKVELSMIDNHGKEIDRIKSNFYGPF